ncbi:MAG: choice-of-anchor D domain-containing protein, partial [Ignavibacteriota bacterium]
MKTVYPLIGRKFFSGILILLGFLGTAALIPSNSFGSLQGIAFQTGSGSMTSISGTVLWQGGGRQTYLASGVINIGFTFVFDGVSYTQMRVYGSGMITLGSGQINNVQGNSPCNFNTLPNTNIPTIAAYWGDYGMSNGGNCQTPKISYSSQGATGSRVMVVEYSNVSVLSRNCGYYGEALSTFQIRLYEGGKIELYYDHMTSTGTCGGWGGSTFNSFGSIGVTEGPNNFVSITPVSNTNNATLDYSNSNDNIDFSQTTIPDKTMYSFIPPNTQMKVTPKSLDFGALVAGTSSAPQCVTVQSVSTDPLPQLTINSATITGSSDFQIVSSPASNTYSIGQTGQYCIKFTPSTAGIRSAVLNISSNGRDSGQASITLSGVGLVAEYTIDSLVRFRKTRTKLGDTLTQWLHITSTGGAPLFFSSFTILGADAGQYFISRFPVNNPMNPGVSDSIGVSYVPTIEGKHVATLRLISNSFLHASQDISLEGTGTLPHFVTTPTIVLFDSIREGDTACKTVDIWNPGSDTLRILTNYLSSNDGDFHYTGLDAVTSIIPPDIHRIVTICVTPLQQGQRQARLVLTTNIKKTFETPRRDTGSLRFIDIRATGVPFGVFGNSTDGSPFHDSAVVGTTKCRQDSLRNTGDADILIKSITIGGTTPADFSYSGFPALPFLLKARSVVVFTVCGTPDAKGLISATATITGTTSGSNITTVIPLSIYGINICAAPVPNALFSDASVTPATTVKVLKGSDTTMCEMIINCGDVAASYTAVINGVDASQYTITSANPSAIIAPGDTTLFCIKFNAAKLGVGNATLNVTTPNITAI